MPAYAGSHPPKEIAMRSRHVFSALLLALATGHATAQQPARLQDASPPSKANQIVGLWQVEVSVRPCAAPAAPPLTFRAINVFHVGGTLSDINTSPPTSRGAGMGIWQHLGQGVYQSRFQFPRFLSTGAFDGFQDVSTSFALAPGANDYTASVDARVLNIDGTLRLALCGTAVGKRVGIE
jgi:hypothetical protein